MNHIIHHVQETVERDRGLYREFEPTESQVHDLQLVMDRKRLLREFRRAMNALPMPAANEPVSVQEYNEIIDQWLGEEDAASDNIQDAIWENEEGDDS